MSLCYEQNYHCFLVSAHNSCRISKNSPIQSRMSLTNTNGNRQQVRQQLGININICPLLSLPFPVVSPLQSHALVTHANVSIKKNLIDL
jgi:hypothetical protein